MDTVQLASRVNAVIASAEVLLPIATVRQPNPQPPFTRIQSLMLHFFAQACRHYLLALQFAD